MNKEVNTALIVLNYNKYELTKRVVNNLQNINFLGHIVIVDNNSQNESFKILYESLNSENKRTYVIKSDNNGGYASGNNIGIKYILNKCLDIEYIGILNPDVIVNKSFSIENLINNIKDRDDIAGITPTQLYNGKYSLRNIGWKLPKFSDIFVSNISFIYKIFDLTRYSSLNIDSKNNSIAQIDVMPGCFFLIKSDVLKEINYLDENTFLYYEENILAKKVKEAGYKFMVSLEQFYIHDHQEKNNDAKKLKYRIKDYKYSLKSQKYYIKEYLKVGILGNLLINIVSIFHMCIEIPLINFIKNKIISYKLD